MSSRSPCGSVDRNYTFSSPTVAFLAVSLPVRSVDRNSKEKELEKMSRPSLPVRERGSKRLRHAPVDERQRVAPRAGAWIEILRSPANAREGNLSLPVRERGSELSQPKTERLSGSKLPPVRERGSKLCRLGMGFSLVPGRSPCGAWIETFLICFTHRFEDRVAPRAERGSNYLADVR